MDKVFEVIGVLIITVVAVCVFGLFLAWPLMILWNACLVPAVQGLREIGWIQAWGIMIVCGMLFKSTSSK